MILVDLLPTLVAELQAALRTAGHPALAERLPRARLRAQDHDASTHRTELAFVPEGEVVGAEEGPRERIALEHRYGAVLHTDGRGGIARLVFEQGTPVAEALGRVSPLQAG
jgi:hypothetical protein